MTATAGNGSGTGDSKTGEDGNDRMKTTTRHKTDGMMEVEVTEQQRQRQQLQQLNRKQEVETAQNLLSSTSMEDLDMRHYLQPARQDKKRPNPV